MPIIILDIETTGLSLIRGDRLIEICCLKLNKYYSVKYLFHKYVNPEFLINNNAFKIHGISNIFLKSKPKFSDIVFDFIKFIYKSDIVIHNSSFDLAFINFELNKLGFKEINFYCNKIIDSLKLAKKLFPKKRNSLDFLCKRFNIKNDRNLHSALSDCYLLLKVYFIMIKKQKFLIFNNNSPKTRFTYLKFKNNILLKPLKKELINHSFFLKKYLNN